MSPIDLERLLDRFRPDRREFLRTLVIGTAYATPLVTSFSMEGLGLDAALAQPICTSNLVANTADVVITKEATPEPVIAGENLTYTITVFNCGPATANAVEVRDLLPTGATFVSSQQTSGATPFTISQPSVGSEGQAWFASTASFPNGETAVFEIVVQVNP